MLVVGYVWSGVVAVAAGGAGTASSKDDYVGLLRIDLRATKAEIVTNALELSGEELERFWPLYREYDEAMAALDAERVAMLRAFSANYAEIDDARAEDMTRRSFEYERQRLALLEKYYGRVAEVFNAATAARFVQLEYQLVRMVDVQLASELPLIPRKAILGRVSSP